MSAHERTPSSIGASSARFAALVALVAASAAVIGIALGLVIVAMQGSDAGMWLMARASGITAYLLLTLVTITGLVLAHPQRAAWRWWSPATRIRTHVVLTVFTLAFIVVHVVVLALDPWAKVGWAGALLPFGAEYRPLPVTLGLLSLWAGLIAGVSAGLAGRFAGRWWRPLHRLAGVAWILAWVHGVLAGSDTVALAAMYGLTGIAVIVVATWRYAQARHRTRHPRARRVTVDSRRAVAVHLPTDVPTAIPTGGAR